jgi:hypothetical protein
MIKRIAKLDEVINYISNTNWLHHFNYSWKLRLMRFHKKHLDEFFIQTNISVLKKNICSKITFIWKITRIMWEYFISKSILYVCQNATWNQRKNTPKIIQNVPKNKKYKFLPKVPPPQVCFHPLRIFKENMGVDTMFNHN